MAVELVTLCGLLPLAIRIGAAKLASKPHWSIEKLVGMLVDERSRLDHLSYGSLDVRASVAFSYDGQDRNIRRLLRMLAAIDLPEVTVWASAAILDTTLNEAEECLEQLFDAQLLDIAGHDLNGQPRYRIHDLVRSFAKELIQSESPADLDGVRRRVLGAWLHLADAAHLAIYGAHHDSAGFTAPRWIVDDKVTARITAEPVQWFEVERHSIVIMVELAAVCGQSAACWELACRTYPLFDMGRHFGNLLKILQIALAAVKVTGDVRGEAHLLCCMGQLYTDRNEPENAMESFQTAGSLFRQLHDPHGEAVILSRLALMHRIRGDDDSALSLYHRAQPALRESADHVEEAMALRAIGQIHLQRGAYQEADSYLAEALLASRAGKSPRREAQALLWQGMLRLRQGRDREAETRFHEVLDLCRSGGDIPGQAISLKGLSTCHEKRGDRTAARAALTDALSLVRQPRQTKMEAQILDALDRLDASPKVGLDRGLV
jgi:tetratricopeptide (TPR) repeat protein